MRRGVFYLFPLFLLVSFPLLGQQFYHYGARAKGMGGAFVAVVDDATAYYWNPASLSFLYQRGEMLFTAGRELVNRGQMVELLSQADGYLSDYPSSLSPELADVIAGLSSPYSSLSGGSGWSWVVGGGGYSFGVLYGSNALLYPIPDAERISGDPSSPDYIGNNETVLRYRGFKSKEYIFSLSLPLLPDLFFGANVKYIKGKTYLLEERLLGEYETGLSAKELYHRTFTGRVEEEGSFSFDLGFLAILSPRVRLGVVGKDVSKPSFKTALGDKLVLKPRWRVGLAVLATRSLTISCDYDITENRFGDVGPKMRELSFGAEKWFKGRTIAVRGGGSYNFASDDPLLSRFLVAGGLGLRGRGMLFDFSLSYQKGLGDLGMGFTFGYQF